MSSNCSYRLCSFSFVVLEIRFCSFSFVVLEIRSFLHDSEVSTCCLFPPLRQYCLKSAKPICSCLGSQEVCVGGFHVKLRPLFFFMPVLVNAVSFCYSRDEIMLLNII